MTTIRSFRGKKCFVTGAASGIGEATAKAAAAAGAELFLTDRNADRLAHVAAEIREAGGIVGASRAFDISDYDAVRRFAGDLHREHGSMDVVMNIAAFQGT